MKKWKCCSGPMKNKLVYLTPAYEDMEEIVKIHLAEAGAVSARRIYDLMKKEISRLSDFPLIGQTHPDPLLSANNYRKLVISKTYVVIYKVIDDTVFIYRIVNAKTDYPKLLK